MTGIVISEGEKYYTDIKAILTLMGDVYKQYNWLISEYECYPQNEEVAMCFSGDSVFVSGEELMRLLDIENFQLIWGVMTAIPQSISGEEVYKYTLPYARNNSSFWDVPVSIQHPLGEIEIVSWDSSATIVKSNDNNVISTIKSKNDKTIDFEVYVR